MLMKNSYDTIGNRTSDLPACSTVPLPTVPPRVMLNKSHYLQGRLKDVKQVTSREKNLAKKLWLSVFFNINQ